MNWWEDDPVADDEESWWSNDPVADEEQPPPQQQTRKVTLESSGDLPEGSFREPKERSAGRAAREGVGFLADNVAQPLLEQVGRTWKGYETGERVYGELMKRGREGIEEGVLAEPVRQAKEAAPHVFTEEGGWGGEPGQHPIYGDAREQRGQAVEQVKDDLSRAAGGVKRAFEGATRWASGKPQWEFAKDFFNPPPRPEDVATVEVFQEHASKGRRPPPESVQAAAAWARENPQMVDEVGLAEILYWREFYKRRSNRE